MKIVMLTDVYDERLQFQDNLLGKYYVKHGHEVTVIAASVENTIDYYADRYERGGPPREYRDGEVTVVKLPYSLNILNRLRKFGGVRAILQREAPDLIFAHDVHLNLSDAVWYKRRHPNCRIIMDCHADYTNSAKNWLSLNILHRVIRRTFLSFYKHHIDRFFPVVPGSATFLREVYGIQHEQMELLPLGADTDLARKTKHDRAGARIRREFGIPDEAIVVFTGGKFMPAKKTHLLIQALAEGDASDLHLLLVGDAWKGQLEYKRLLLGLGSSNPRVHFAGWVDGKEVYRYMDASDLAVFPASQSVLWQQSLSMGLPLIVGAGTESGNQDPSYMNPYGAIVILPVEDIRSDVIAREIRRMTSDRERLREMQSAAQRTADELLDYDIIVEKTLQREGRLPDRDDQCR